MGGGGVQRTLGFVRHLPGFGWRPTVLAAHEGAPYWATDRHLLTQLGQQTDIRRVAMDRIGPWIHRMRKLQPRRLRTRFEGTLLIPDPEILWFRPARKHALHCLKTHPFDALYSTGSPWTNHLVAQSIHHQTGLPWIADFRDPWYGGPAFTPPSRVHRRIHHRLERRVRQDAHRLIANTQLQRVNSIRAFPFARHKTIHIPNGYEEDDFRTVASPPSRDGVLEIGYAGSFYPGYQPHRAFELFGAFLANNPGFKTRLKITLMGNTHQETNVRGTVLENVVQELGYRPHAEAMTRLAACHATLLIVPECRAPSATVPQKLYPYLRLGRPILAVGPRGEAFDILRDANGPSLAIDSSAPGDGLVALERWLLQLNEGTLDGIAYRSDVVAKYDRRSLTARLAEALREITGDNGL